MLEINTKAPAFTLVDDSNVKRKLSEFKGKWVVLYFYPKDDTPGCTKEACGIAEVYDDFAKLGVTVLGVSKDSPATHTKFKEKYNLPFTLLSDESTEMMQSYEAWKEKSMFGKKYMGIVRITYILNPSGKIAKAYPKVTPADHALTLLKDLENLIQAK
ncbi:thioredoxin-dependent thiol peroxidase [Candidatus Nomurabacteria bacterium]|nr:thioredoxin-dependent thiol peroxidase [Candidatus Nomurabacteria bacterium]MCB9818534.1 thioredoxin-dependent thiol peroxidase [Candidatus Nomurabacteria bacterium]